ncbi:iron complex transport system substrate-binding protein [Crenobacter luteus]|uniref:ABC transporter substrate-binding protein n=1 Tax=Crenobacter luteus TaxID=1452487 RepID=UPI0010D6F9E4|nr:ABC transporter substrate-binding protein [Crenobacter luteus]TCP10596.1 iron complex transport system substrate-binding protein [Crenobacter luteus]
MSHYRRIACLSTEAVETLYLLGTEDRVAGISGFTVHPPEARRDKPKISGFSSARLERILAVEPDLVVAFSDMQAELAAELIRAGLEVHVFNQRTLSGVLAMVRALGALVGAGERAEALAAELAARIEAARADAAAQTRKPRVYFEEWDAPLISGVGWVSELIALAGGVDVFADTAHHSSATRRIVADPDEVVRRAPDIVIGSWCGKKFRPERLAERAGWSAIPAVRDGRVLEIKSADILSPGPAAILRGLPQLQAAVAAWREAR